MDDITKRAAERYLGRPPVDANEARQAAQVADQLAQAEAGLSKQGQWFRWMLRKAADHPDLSINRSPLPVERDGWGSKDVAFYGSRQAWPLSVRKQCLHAARYTRDDDLERWLESRQAEGSFWVVFRTSDVEYARGVWKRARRLGWTVKHADVANGVAIRFTDTRKTKGTLPGRREGKPGTVVQR